jgi:hypothetical protein
MAKSTDKQLQLQSLASSFLRVGQDVNVVDFNSTMQSIKITAIDAVGVYGDKLDSPRQHRLYPWTTIHHVSQAF